METEFNEATTQKLEALKHDWRKWPILVKAVNNVEDIVQHPEKYQCQNLLWENEPSVSLTDEVKFNHPLTMINYFYDISSPEQRKKRPWRATVLQVSFKLCNSISTPRPEHFDPIVAILHTPVYEGTIDWFGNGALDRIELRFKKGLGGSQLLPLFKSDSVGETRGEIRRLTDSNLASNEPVLVEYYNWTGNKVDILPLSSSAK